MIVDQFLGKETLTWKSLETDDFIEEATSLILEDCYKKLQAVQAAQTQIEHKVAHWHEYLCQSLFTSDSACYIEDWIIRQKDVRIIIIGRFHLPLRMYAFG